MFVTFRWNQSMNRKREAGSSSGGLEASGMERCLPQRSAGKRGRALAAASNTCLDIWTAQSRTRWRDRPGAATIMISLHGGHSDMWRWGH